MFAMFPLSLVKESLSKQGNCPDLQDRFGYIRAKQMTAAVIYSTPDLRNVHCGSLPLVGWVGFRQWHRFGNLVRGCYINSANQQVYSE